MPESTHHHPTPIQKDPSQIEPFDFINTHVIPPIPAFFDLPPVLLFQPLIIAMASKLNQRARFIPT
jgi:hypothetical protein